MPTGGRKPTPTALKKLRGNPGKRAMNRAEPKPKTKAMPTPPGHLDRVARNEWRRVARRLFDLGVLTHFDRVALAGYCVAYSRWVEAELAIRENGMIMEVGNGYLQISPWATASKQAMKQMHTFMVELGLTPSSRSRVKANPPEEKDPMEAFLTGER